MSAKIKWNHGVEDAPYQTVLWVKNDMMDKPVKATRGYVTDSGVHKDQKLFTSVYTPDKFWSCPAGNLVCPTHWAELEKEKA